jgi:hypothetical protein
VTERVGASVDLGPEFCLQRLCLALDELAASDNDFIQANFSRKLTREQAVVIQKLNDQLEGASQSSPEWRDYLQRKMQEASASIQGVARLERAAGVPQGSQSDDVSSLVKTHIAQFSALLRAWPAIREAAQALINQRD